MRLEPGRTSLSGRPDFLRPPEPVQTSAIALAPRFCASCGCEDLIQTVHEEGGSRIEHKVTIELKYLKKPEECTFYMQSKGWKPRILQGRPAMERFICRPCITGHELMQKEFSQKRAKELRSSANHDTFYSAMCGE